MRHRGCRLRRGADQADPAARALLLKEIPPADPVGRSGEPIASALLLQGTLAAGSSLTCRGSPGTATGSPVDTSRLSWNYGPENLLGTIPTQNSLEDAVATTAISATDS